MIDLQDRLRTYGEFHDEVVEPIGMDEVTTPSRTSLTGSPSLIAVAAALAVLLVVGGIAWLARSNRAGVPATTVTSTTIGFGATIEDLGWSIVETAVPMTSPIVLPNGTFVAATETPSFQFGFREYGAAIVTSTDAAEWRLHDVEQFLGVEMSDLVAVGDVAMAAIELPQGGAELWWTDDGAAWSRAALEVDGIRLPLVVHDGVVGGSLSCCSAAWHSGAALIASRPRSHRILDGDGATLVITNSSCGFRHQQAASEFVVGCVVVSRDGGRTFVGVEHFLEVAAGSGELALEWAWVADGEFHVVAGHRDGAKVLWRSSDGMTWDEVGSVTGLPDLRVPVAGLLDLPGTLPDIRAMSSDGLVLAVNLDTPESMWTSADGGLTFTRATPLPGEGGRAVAIAHVRDGALFGVRDGEIWLTGDGETWLPAGTVDTLGPSLFHGVGLSHLVPAATAPSGAASGATTVTTPRPTVVGDAEDVGWVRYETEFPITRPVRIGQGRLLAIGQHPELRSEMGRSGIVMSEDGDSWTPVRSQFERNYRYRTLIGVGDVAIAMTSPPNNSPDRRRRSLRWTDDGAAWSDIVVHHREASHPVTYQPDTAVAAGALECGDPSWSMIVALSRSIVRFVENGDAVLALAPGLPRCAGSASGTVAHSSDGGRSFTMIEHFAELAETSAAPIEIAWAWVRSGHFHVVVIADGVATLWRSPDGLSWERLFPVYGLPAWRDELGLRSLVVDDAVIVATTDRLYISRDDGRSFELIAAAGPPGRGRITAVADGWIWVREATRWLVSPDGFDWFLVSGLSDELSQTHSLPPIGR